MRPEAAAWPSRCARAVSGRRIGNGGDRETCDCHLVVDIEDLRPGHGVHRGIVEADDGERRDCRIALQLAIADRNLDMAVGSRGILARAAECDLLQRRLVVGER